MGHLKVTVHTSDVLWRQILVQTQSRTSLNTQASGTGPSETLTLMIAFTKNALTSMEHLKDRIKSICIHKMAEWISTFMRHILSFLAEPFFRLTHKKRLAIPNFFSIIQSILHASMKVKKLCPNIQINKNLLVFCN